jgi:hypothetical protein
VSEVDIPARAVAAEHDDGGLGRHCHVPDDLIGDRLGEDHGRDGLQAQGFVHYGIASIMVVGGPPRDAYAPRATRTTAPTDSSICARARSAVSSGLGWKRRWYGSGASARRFSIGNSSLSRPGPGGRAGQIGQHPHH